MSSEFGKIVYKFNNGMLVYSMETESDHYREGDRTNTCMHDIHWKPVSIGWQRFFSIRTSPDRGNKTLAMIFTADTKKKGYDGIAPLKKVYPPDWKIVEIKSKNNQIPSPKLIPFIREFLETRWEFPDDYTSHGVYDYLSLHRNHEDWLGMYIQSQYYGENYEK